MATQWEVIAVNDKGGIIVREGQDLKSPQSPDRLYTGSLIEEIVLVGDRLSYKLLKGNGPPLGWVSLKLKDKILVQRVETEHLPKIESVPIPAAPIFKGKDANSEDRGRREVAAVEAVEKNAESIGDREKQLVIEKSTEQVTEKKETKTLQCSENEVGPNKIATEKHKTDSENKRTSQTLQSSTQPPQKLGEPLGEKPHMEIVLRPMNDSELVSASGYLVATNKNVTVGELYQHVCSHLDSDIAEMLTPFVCDGKSLEQTLTLEQNQVTLPGPAARRAGQKLKLFFDLKQDVVSAKRKAAELQEQMRKEKEQRRQEVIEQQEAQRQKQIEEEEKRHEESRGLITWVERNIGASRAVSAEQRASDPEMEDPKNYLELCSKEECDALTLLLQQATGHSFLSWFRSAHVLAAFRNDSPILRERYEYSKARMQRASASIRKASSFTAEIVHRNATKLEVLGKYDAAVNEFPLWHGTPTTAGAQGICRNGFDINFVGTTTDYGWYGPGFYFCDEAGVSMGYGRSTHHVNSQFPRCQMILLNRVVVGNIRVQERISGNDEENQMRVTAECLGPGGVFGPQSKFHTLLGQGNEYVCMSSHQIYPEYVIIYTMDNIPRD